MKIKTSHIYIVFTLLAVVSLSLEDDPIGRSSGQSVRHHIVKRKGKSGGRSRGSSRKSQPRQPPPNSYPKQPAYNPSYQQPNYNPSNTGHGQPGYKPNYGQNAGGLGGGIMGGKGHKSGVGGLLGAGAIGGLGGAALGAYGGYKLGKMVGGLGRGGHYGYYENDRYMRCDPPQPKQIMWDSEKNISYIPHESGYDQRCSYYDREPPRNYGYQNQYGNRYANSAGTQGFDLNLISISLIISLIHLKYNTFNSLFKFMFIFC